MRFDKAIRLTVTLLLCFLFSGCGVKAKLRKSLSRADAYYAKKDYENARLEYLNAMRVQPQNPEIYARLGVILFDRGEYAVAAPYLGHARQLNTTNLTARADYGLLVLNQGKVKEARAEAETILKQNPVDPDGLLLLSNALTSKDEVLSTQAQYEQLTRANPTNAFIHLALGNLHYKVRDFPTAEGELKKAISLAPNVAKFHLALATLYVTQGDTNKADASFKSAVDLAPAKSPEAIRWAEFKVRIGQIDAAKKILQDNLQKNPEYVPALSTLADITLGESKFDEAAGYLQKLLSIEPNNFNGLMNRAKLELQKNEPSKALEDLTLLARPGWYENVPVVHYQTALAELQLKDKAKAMGALERAISLNTNYTDAIVLKAQIQIQNLDFASAIPLLSQASAAHPNDPRLPNLLASAYQGRKSPEQALAVYEQMARKFPGDGLPLYNAGLIYKEQQKLDLARAAFEKALERSPNAALVIDELIGLDMMAKNYPAARARIDHYLKEYPDKALPHYLEAKILLAQRKVPEGEAALTKTLELEPNNLLAHKLLAEVFSATGRPADALKHYEILANKDTNDLPSLFMVGTLQESLGNISAAQATYQKILSVNPDFPAALNNLAGLLTENGGDLNLAAELARKGRGASGISPQVRASLSDTLGWIYYKQGDYSRARQLCEESAAVLKLQPEVLYHVGMAYYMTGNDAQARGTLQSSLQTTNEFKGRKDAGSALAVLALDTHSPTPDAVKVLTGRLSDYPTDPIAHFKLARLYASQNANEKAESEFNASIKLNPKSASVLAETAAFTLDRLQNKEKALELAKQARAAASDNKNYFDIGRVGFLAGDAIWALPLLQEALTLDSSNSRLAYYTGLAAFASGQTRLAEEKLSFSVHATSQFPESEFAKPALDVVHFYSQPGSPAQVEAAISNWLAKDPQSTIANFGSAFLLETKKDEKSAADAYENILKSNPGFIPALRQLAILYSEKLPNDNRASELATKARAALPEDALLMKAQGKIAFRKGDYKEAVRLLRDSSRRLEKEDSDLLYYLGMAQYKLNDKQARQSLSRALSLDKSSAMAADAEKAVAELK